MKGYPTFPVMEPHHLMVLCQNQVTRCWEGFYRSAEMQLYFKTPANWDVTFSNINHLFAYIQMVSGIAI